MGKKRQTSPHEVVPLMTAGPSRGQHRGDDDTDDDDDEACWLKVVVDPDKHHKGASLLATDAVLLTLHYIQVFCLLQSLALRWPWPEAWLSWAKYLFLLNLDVWEFMKMWTPGAYEYVQNHYTASAAIPFRYWTLLAAWGALAGLLLVVYVGCYCGFSRKPSPRMLVRLSTLKQLLVLAVQLLAIPLGVVLLRLLHCTDDNFLDVDNLVYCYRGSHWAYLAPVIAVMALVFVAFPLWLIVRTKAELMDMSEYQHEGHLQLKEMEYLHGLDIVWLVGSYPLFASFRKQGVHFRACHLIALGVLLVLYGALGRYPFYQAVALTTGLFVLFLTFLILFPFRVKAYNIMLCVNYFCLTITALMGSFKTSYQVGVVSSPWLLPYYQNLTLVVTNAFWLFCVLVFITYVIARNACCPRRQVDPLWPHRKFHKLSPQTRKYMRGIIISRLLIEKVLSSVAMFAPVHEVSRYIHVINAYCREAEVHHDPLQNTLWDVLDQLIDVHTNVAPRSLFAESTKYSIRRTAEEFMVMMPSFVRRLAQREYDLILVRPVKRRILLKLYCLSLFLKGRRARRDHHELTIPTIQKLWHKTSDDESDPGYYEDMYPGREPLVTSRPQTYDAGLLLRLEDEDEDDAEDVIADTERWLRGHGGPAGGGDPLADWLGALGVTEAWPDTVEAELVLPADLTIPSLEDPGLRTPAGRSARLGTPRGATPRGATPFNMSRPVTAQSLGPPPSSSRPASALSVPSRPGSAVSRHTPSPRPGSALSGPSRPASAASGRPQSSVRTSNVSLPHNASVTSLAGLPGAIEDSPPRAPTPRGSREGSTATLQPPGGTRSPTQGSDDASQMV